MLGRLFRKAGHVILQVVSRNASAASALAYEWDTKSTNYLSTVNPEGDIYIIAVNDDAIAKVTDAIRMPGKVVAHTAASVPKEILHPVTEHYGVFYPLQSLRKEMTELPDVPVYYDGSDAYSKKMLRELAESVAPGKAAEAGDEARGKLHVAAVLVSNFTNHLYALAEEYCRREGLDFHSLLPLIEETAHRLRQVSPKEAQTGPAVRGDRETIEQHLRLLESYPELKELYLFFTRRIGS